MNHIELNMKESSYLAYKQRLDDFAKDYFSGWKINEITPLALTQWQNTLNDPEKDYSYKYKSSIRGALYSFFEYLQLYEISNTLKKVKAFKNHDMAREILFWTEDEFYIFIKTVDDIKYRALFLFSI